jgi:hypothetical protein
LKVGNTVTGATQVGEKLWWGSQLAANNRNTSETQHCGAKALELRAGRPGDLNPCRPQPGDTTAHTFLQRHIVLVAFSANESQMIFWFYSGLPQVEVAH